MGNETISVGFMEIHYCILWTMGKGKGKKLTYIDGVKPMLHDIQGFSAANYFNRHELVRLNKLLVF